MPGKLKGLKGHYLICILFHVSGIISSALVISSVLYVNLLNNDKIIFIPY